MIDTLRFDALAARDIIARALAEDLGDAGDVTSRVAVPEGAAGKARFISREPGVLAGSPLIPLVFAATGGRVEVETYVAEGRSFAASTLLARAEGDARTLLAGERLALNLLQRLSGIATLTRRFAEEVAGTSARILDTRKTTPLLRPLERYAVRAGGGSNHRDGLHDQVLIKDNHLRALAAAGRRLSDVVAEARRLLPGAPVEVEAGSEDEARTALASGADIILLDNFWPDDLARIVRVLRSTPPPPGRPAPLLESSGGIRLENVRRYAESGVDRISVGALTHSARALDIAMKFE